MVAPSVNADGDSPELIEVLVSYTQALERGEQPDRGALLARYQHLAADLQEYFLGQDELSGLQMPASKLATQRVPRTPSETDHVSLPDQPVSRSWGDYEVLGKIAHGGMGVVYRARQKSLQRIVAIKMIRAGDLATASEVQRFRREAELAAQLEHPNIVPIYEIGDHDGRLYFTMKLIEGESLADKVRGQGSGVSESKAIPGGRPASSL
jgi:eukaryotic-like serine/threonine-protein kinase